MRWPSSSPRAQLILRCAAIGFLVALVAPFFAGVHWAFELPVHFRAQLSAGAVLVTFGFILLRAWPYVVFSGGIAGCFAVPVMLLWCPTSLASDADERTVRLLGLNVSLYSRGYEAVRAMIVESPPDVVGFVEVNSRWARELVWLNDPYPYRISRFRENGFGVALASRYPLDAIDLGPHIDSHTVWVAATIHVHDRPLKVILVHLPVPLGGANVALRNRQFDMLGEIVGASGDTNVVVMGDFNTSQWSRGFRRLLHGTDLRNASAGYGYVPTWPAQIPLLRIPIDHYLVSDGITVRDFATAGATGSDHLAIYVEIGLPAER